MGKIYLNLLEMLIKKNCFDKKLINNKNTGFCQLYVSTNICKVKAILGWLSFWRGRRRGGAVPNAAPLPDVQNIRNACVGLGHRAAEIPNPMLDIRLPVEDLDEVEVTVVWLSELVLLELDVNLLALLGPDDPGAVHRCAPTPRVLQLLAGYIRSPCNISLTLLTTY